MPGLLFCFLANDHERLDGLLRRAMTEAGAVDRAASAEFRAGLLRHISLEEKILLPAAQRWQGGDPLPIAAKLRLDHGVLAALLVPTPTPAIIAAIRTVLTAHNALEEGPGGVYERREQLAGVEADALLAQLQAAPDVPVAPYADGPQVMRVVRRALARAGYEIELGEQSEARLRLRKNADGSVDVYFGPNAPEGQGSNWIPTAADKAYFLYFRFYGPQPPLFAKTWKLPDLEPVQ